MNRSRLTSLTLSLLLLTTGSALTRPAFAKQRKRPPQPAQQLASIEQLRQQLRRMAAAERTDATPPEVRNVNRAAAIAESRARLRELLQTRLDGLLAYRTESRGSLSPKVAASLDESINELFAEINTLRRGATAQQQKTSGRKRPTPPTRRPARPNPSEEGEEETAEQPAPQDGDEESQEEEEDDEQAADADLIIHAPKQVSEEEAQVSVTNTNPRIKRFTLYLNGKVVPESELADADIALTSGEPKDVHFTVKLAKDKTNTLSVHGLTAAGKFVSETNLYRIKHVTPPKKKTPKKRPEPPTPGGGDKEDGKDEKDDSRITITQPSEEAAFVDASTVELKFTVTPPDAAKKQPKIEEIFVAVLNDGAPVRQPDPKPKVRYDATDKDKPLETTIRVRVGGGENEIRLFSGYQDGEPKDLARVTIKCEGEKCGGRPSRITILKPSEGTTYDGEGRVQVRFTVTKPEGTLPKIERVFFNVLNRGISVDQGLPNPSVTVPYNDEEGKKDEPLETGANVRLARGTNVVQLFTGFDGDEGLQNLTTRTIICEGDRCGTPVSNIISNSMHMRAIVGFEQAGASSAPSKGNPFIDLFFFGPFRYGKSCKGAGKVEERGPDGKTRLRNRLVGQEVDPDNCYPTWSTWGNVRFSSVPQDVSSFGALASDVLGPLEEGQLTELVQGFNYMAGLDRFIISSDNSYISPIPGIRHKTAMYFTGGFGAVSPLTPEQSAQIYRVPGPDNPQRAAFLEEFSLPDDAELVAFVTPERDRFLRQYYVGLRFKTFFLERDGATHINRFPAVLDVTFGQSEAVTGGRLRGGVFRLEAFYPFPLREASFLYFYGSAFMKIGGRQTIRRPYALVRPETTVRLTDDNVFIRERQFNRDFYRIGVGINLTDLFNRNRQPTQ